MARKEELQEFIKIYKAMWDAGYHVIRVSKTFSVAEGRPMIMEFGPKSEGHSLALEELEKELAFLG